MSRGSLGIAAVTALVLAHFAAVALSLDSPDRLRLSHDLAGWMGSVLGVWGTWAAARAFARTDYLRRVWTLLAVGAVLLLLGTALRSYWTHAMPNRPFIESPLLPYRMVVVVAANVVTVAALVLLAYTYRASGLKPPPSWQGVLVWLLAAAGALAIAAPQYVADFRKAAEGGAQAVSSITNIASTVGDMATVMLMAPILRVAYWMRGGKLARVWWAMAASGAVWLVYDARDLLAALLPGDAAHNVELIRVTRSLGLSLVGLAGWLQRDAVEKPT